MIDTNTTAHEQRGICRHCDGVVTRQPGESEWRSRPTGAECFVSDDEDIEPGVHEPIAVVDRPTEIESTTTPSTLPLPPPRIPRFTPLGQ